MIFVYQPDRTDFSMYGNGVLLTLSCKATVTGRSDTTLIIGGMAEHSSRRAENLLATTRAF